VHGFEQTFANVVHPASERAPRPRHESPAPQSESELQTAPAGLSGVLLHARKGINSAKNKVDAMTLDIAIYYINCTQT
jgi:hypothetical protein